jgi:hypothetical protein
MIRRFIFVIHVYWINIFGKSNRISFVLLNKSEQLLGFIVTFYWLAIFYGDYFILSIFLITIHEDLTRDRKT